MGTSVTHNRTQKNYRQDGEVQQTQLRGSNGRPVNSGDGNAYRTEENKPQSARDVERREDQRPKDRAIAKSALPPRPVKTSMTTSVYVKDNKQSNIKQSNIRPGSAYGTELRPPSASGVRQSSNVSSIAGTNDRIVQLNDSKIYIHSEKALDSKMMISAINVQGFQGTEFEGKRVKKFNISIDVEEKQLIKESNYFDESNEDLGLYGLVPPKYGDFSVGQFDSLGTISVKTYLFDVALKERIAS